MLLVFPMKAGNLLQVLTSSEGRIKGLKLGLQSPAVLCNRKWQAKDTS